MKRLSDRTSQLNARLAVGESSYLHSKSSPTRRDKQWVPIKFRTAPAIHVYLKAAAHAHGVSMNDILNYTCRIYAPVLTDVTTMPLLFAVPAEARGSESMLRAWLAAVNEEIIAAHKFDPVITPQIPYYP